MPGYVIADVTVTDEETYAGYRALTPATIDAFGGRFLVRGGACEAIEGAWAPGRLVLIGFASAARAAAWYDSPAYTKARAIRQRASTGSLILVGGVARGAGGACLIARSGARDAADDTEAEPPGVAAHGGRVLVRDGVPEVREGAWPGARVAVLEFTDPAAARAWYGSDEYRPVRERRAASSPVDAILAQGV